MRSPVARRTSPLGLFARMLATDPLPRITPLLEIAPPVSCSASAPRSISPPFVIPPTALKVPLPAILPAEPIVVRPLTFTVPLVCKLSVTTPVVEVPIVSDFIVAAAAGPATVKPMPGLIVTSVIDVAGWQKSQLPGASQLPPEGIHPVQLQRIEQHQPGLRNSGGADAISANRSAVAGNGAGVIERPARYVQAIIGL